ncbi:MAG: sigma-70 family RNA polymerase sigma factor [Anaerolineae bacterium]
MTEEQALLRGARELDEPALDEIFETYYPLLYRYIYQHVRHRTTAEDLAAEVFARMLAQLSKGRGPKRHLQAWLYRVAHNLVIDHTRRQVHRDHDPLNEGIVSTEHDVEMEVHSSILRQQATAALQRLTPMQRAVIILKYLEGYTNAEVAPMLELTVGAVKALQHRGLASMRRYLAHIRESRED